VYACVPISRHLNIYQCLKVILCVSRTIILNKYKMFKLRIGCILYAWLGTLLVTSTKHWFGSNFFHQSNFMRQLCLMFVGTIPGHHYPLTQSNKDSFNLRYQWDFIDQQHSPTRFRSEHRCGRYIFIKPASAFQRDWHVKRSQYRIFCLWCHTKQP
jgi:hypothetical protein